MSDFSNKELFDMIRDLNIASDVKTKQLFESFEESVSKDIDLAILKAKEETMSMIHDSLPDDHTNDHDVVQMLRRWSRAFFDGIFGTAGKIVLTMFILGVFVQVYVGKDVLLTKELVEVISR